MTPRTPHGTLNYTSDTPDTQTCTRALAAACKPLDDLTDDALEQMAASVGSDTVWRVLQAARALLRAEGMR